VTFAHPALAILAAFALPALFVARRIPASLGCRNTYAYSSLTFMNGALTATQRPYVLLDLAYAVSFALLLAASAGPRLWTMAAIRAAVVFCVDTSGSMNARDVLPSRAGATVRAMKAFVNAMLPGTPAGIVSFAGVAQRIVPLTRERNAVIAGLAAIPAPNGQTAIGDGLVAAAAALPPAGPRAIVLITDGENNHGEDPGNAVRTLAASRIRLDAIVIGSARSRPLQSYALETGGVFSRAGSAAALTAQMTRLAQAQFTARVPRDGTAVCVVAALLLGAAAWLAAAGAARR